MTSKSVLNPCFITLSCDTLNNVTLVPTPKGGSQTKDFPPVRATYGAVVQKKGRVIKPFREKCALGSPERKREKRNEKVKQDTGQEQSPSLEATFKKCISLETSIQSTSAFKTHQLKMECERAPPQTNALFLERRKRVVCVTGADGSVGAASPGSFPLKLVTLPLRSWDKEQRRKCQPHGQHMGAIRKKDFRQLRELSVNSKLPGHPLQTTPGTSHTEDSCVFSL